MRAPLWASREPMNVVRLLPTGRLPAQTSTGAAGFDLAAAVATVVPGSRSTGRGAVTIGRALVRTGIAIHLPAGSVGRIGSRSSMSTRLNIEVGAGWIDRDYRGEILVELKNLGDKPVAISVGDRIAHLLVLRTIRVKPRLVRRLTPTRRATRGFGSTGGLPDARTD